MSDERKLSAKQLGIALTDLRENSPSFRLFEQVVRRSFDLGRMNADAIQFGIRMDPNAAPMSETEYIALKSRAEGHLEGIARVLADLEGLQETLLAGKLPDFIKRREGA